MSTKHALPTLRTGLLRVQKLQCSGSLPEWWSSKVRDADRENKNERETIMQAAADLDDHDH